MRYPHPGLLLTGAMPCVLPVTARAGARSAVSAIDAAEPPFSRSRLLDVRPTTPAWGRELLPSTDDRPHSNHEDRPHSDHYMGNGDADERPLFCEHPAPEQAGHERRDAEPEADK
jgi:hypothetical protein